MVNNSMQQCEISEIEELRQIWMETTGDRRICIAVLDGPADLSHPCFAGADVVQVNTLVSAAINQGPSLAHGIHVASILFGQHSSSVKGICPDCRGLIVPIFEDDQNGSMKTCSQLDLARAI